MLLLHITVSRMKSLDKCALLLTFSEELFYSGWLFTAFFSVIFRSLIHTGFGGLAL